MLGDYKDFLFDAIATVTIKQVDGLREIYYVSRCCRIKIKANSNNDIIIFYQNNYIYVVYIVLIILSLITITISIILFIYRILSKTQCLVIIIHKDAIHCAYINYITRNVV